jgi:Zn finger protein HypA/HybF involved in hydrogenase expression
MATPDYVRCEKCDSESPVVMIKGGGGSLWPKSTVRRDTLYVFINCPKCGEREQMIASAAEIENFNRD